MLYKKSSTTLFISLAQCRIITTFAANLNQLLQMKKVLAMAAVALFMVSCSDDSSDSTNNGSDLVLVKKMIDNFDGELTTSILTYDGNKLLSLVSDDDTHTDYIYENGLLVREEAFDGTEMYNKVAYFYDSNNKLSSSIDTSFSGEGESSAAKNVYTYNSNGTISVTIYTGDKDAQSQLYGTGIVTLTNGNITKYAFTYADGSAGETVISTFDDKNSPFKNTFAEDVMTLAMLEGGSTNNMLTNDHPGTDYDFTSTYIYNDAGYPTKETNYWSGTLDYETQFFYE